MSPAPASHPPPLPNLCQLQEAIQEGTELPLPGYRLAGPYPEPLTIMYQHRAGAQPEGMRRGARGSLLTMAAVCAQN